MLRYLCLILFIVGCQTDQLVVDPVEVPVESVQSLVVTSPVVESPQPSTPKGRCEENGGVWEKEQGIMVPEESLEYSCFEKYDDVGTTCTDGSQCEGECVVSSSCADGETCGVCSDSWSANCAFVVEGEIEDYCAVI